MVSQPKNYYANVFSFRLVAKIEKPHPGNTGMGLMYWFNSCVY